MFQRSAETAPRVALRTQNRRTMAKFSPSVPTTLPFQGPPVTPIDPTTGYVRLPVVNIPTTIATSPPSQSYSTIQKQFRATLQPWQQLLFGSLRKAGSPNTLVGFLRESRPIMLVSDASVQKNGQSGFAWIIARNHTMLWRGAGLAPGPEEDIYSGRAEAYGLLAATLFLSYYVTCYDEPFPPATIKCFCDNSGVITNLCDLQSGQLTRPNDTTNDDRDIYMEIHTIATQSQALRFQYFHVKGHQDKDPKRQLTLAEHYNVECDREAKIYVQNSNLRSTSFGNPEFKSAQPHLIIGDKVICRRFLPSLREAASLPQYWTYLKKRLQWTQADINLVQWETLSSALNSFLSQDQRRIILFIHNKLPLRTSKFHPHPGSNLCPSCQRNPEDRRHFLECDHQERRRLFESMRLQLAAISLKHHLHPSILTTFWLGMLSIRNDTPYPDLSQELPPELRTTLIQQSRLGWEQLYYGRFTKSWAKAIDALNPTIAPSGRQIMIQLLQVVWRYILATWTTRNKHLHDDAGRLSLPDYQQAVRTLYERGTQLPPAAQAALFQKPLDQMLQQPPSVLRTWLERGHRYMTQQLKAEKTRSRLNTPDIRSFFGFQPQSANDLHPP